MRSGLLHTGVAAAGLLVGCAGGGGGSADVAAPALRAPGGGATVLRRVAPFPVRDATGRPYARPFLGGFEVPRPQFVDIDDDGDPDLFVQERTGELIFFENTGVVGEPHFEWRSDRFQGLDVGEWSRFADLDGDGDFDLLAEEPFSYVRYFRNEGSARDPRYAQVPDSVREADGTPLFSDRQNIPNLVDIDCDGALDLFLGRVDGTVSRYELSGHGPGGAPRFELVTDRFQGIEIVAQIGGQTPGPTRHHGANSMAFADVDGDGDLDFFWGDFFEPGVLFIENTGSCEVPDLRSEPVPVATAPADSLLTSGYNAVAPVDLDADGDVDLAVGVLGGAFDPNRTASSNFHYWERRDDGLLALRTKRFLDGVDVGSESVPALGDLDGDGDLDLLVGNKLDPAVLDAGRLYHFENRGTPSAPDYHLADTLDLGEAYHYAPALGDLDGDGDLDLVLGTWRNDVRLYRNEGGTGADRFTLVDSTLVVLTRGSNAVPALADADGDGDLDLMVGESSGELNFYRNVGSPRSPRFELVSDEYREIDVGRRSQPAFFDIDADGDPDLLVGGEEAGVDLFLNDGTGVFTPDPGFDLPLLPYAAVTFGDVDGDDDPDVISGGFSGGLIFLENQRRR